MYCILIFSFSKEETEMNLKTVVHALLQYNP